MGPYVWKQYNVLVLPRSFPFSGMENPSLSFLSPCLIDKDKSLIDIILSVVRLSNFTASLSLNFPLSKTLFNLIKNSSLFLL